VALGGHHVLSPAYAHGPDEQQHQVGGAEPRKRLRAGVEGGLRQDGDLGQKRIAYIVGIGQEAAQLELNRELLG
jgi:hypothetical protein